MTPPRSRAASPALNSRRLSLDQLPTPKALLGLGVCFWEFAQGRDTDIAMEIASAPRRFGVCDQEEDHAAAR